MMSSAVAAALMAAILFFLLGLLTGVWKYACIRRSATAEAPYYVSMVHRAALMYAFSAQLLAVLAYFSVWSLWVNMLAVLVSVSFFAAAIVSYLVHGILRDTDNQFKQPHQLGKRTLPASLLTVFMVALVCAEIGGFLVLASGACVALKGFF